MGKSSPVEELIYVKIADQAVNMTIYGSSSHMIFLQNGRYMMAGRNDYRQISQSEQIKISAFSSFKMP
ncbi:hypothetical protein [Sphingobacterium faecale]|uniref:hypothetical protein n=1 Tax=Sphingobacterium faecale TaxID=2803775 RepID=UPI0019205D74|nr:hypothetical protein [Sphingobacterium faecale]